MDKEMNLKGKVISRVEIDEFNGEISLFFEDGTSLNILNVFSEDSLIVTLRDSVLYPIQVIEI